MGISIVRLIVSTCNWAAFGFGILFNAVMIGLIARHTPEPMRIYSKILLQTCVTDILLLIFTFLFQPYIFISKKGEIEEIVYGLVTIKGIQNRHWNSLACVWWIFLVYVSMFGYVSQFIYRYLALVRDKSLSTTKYFMLFLLILLFPLIYCVNLFICTYPPEDHALMDEDSVAQILGINLTIDQIVLASYSFNNLSQTLGIYYIIFVCTIAYIIMFILAFRIQKFLKNMSKMSETSAVQKKMLEMNKQVSRNLIIQASMPFIIYLSMLFLLAFNLFKIDISGWNWLQYYNLMTSIPMFLPSALNPIVSIYIIKSYRRVIVSAISDFEKCFKLLFDKQRTTTTVHEMQQHQTEQQQQEVKWAISVIKQWREDFSTWITVVELFELLYCYLVEVGKSLRALSRMCSFASLI